MPGNQGPASDRDRLLPLTADQLQPAYREAIASRNIQIAHTVIKLLWRHLNQALRERP
jgi:hypothetical protein